MKRDHGIDLLKIVAMLMVVMLHVMGHGGVTMACAQNSHSIRYLAEQMLYVSCVPAVDCFVLATGYIMSRHTFKYSRIVKLWGEVVFYSFCMTAIAWACCPWVPITWRNWVGVIFPIATNQYWFVTMYVALFFTMPFLNHLLNTMPEKDVRIMLATGFILFSLYPSLTRQDLFILHGGYSYLWFVYLYLVAGYIAAYGDKFNIRYRSLVGVAAMLPIVTLILQAISSWCGRRFGVRLGVWINYSSPGMLVEAVVMLLLFSRLNIAAAWLRRTIAFVAPGVFSVYLLHDSRMMHKMGCWDGRFAPLAALNIPAMIVGIVGSSVAIFTICIVIDWIRRKLVSRILPR